MRDSSKVLLGSIGFSWLLSLIFLVALLLMTTASITGDIKSILLVNIQLDGVLFGFVATLSAFFFRRITERRLIGMSLVYATTTFISFFFSLIFSFQTLLNIENALFLFKFFPICFTLAGIITTIAFVIDITLRTIRQKEGVSHE